MRDLYTQVRGIIARFSPLFAVVYGSVKRGLSDVLLSGFVSFNDIVSLGWC
jgi:hypothetical protein